MKVNINRNFTYEEWEALPLEEKRGIWNHVWNPFEREIGKETQENLVRAFEEKNKRIKESSLNIGFGWFGHYVACIYVLVADSRVRVPKHFSGLPVNKGVIKEKISDKEFIVDWSIGGANCKFEPYKTEPVDGHQQI